ncbi:MAG: hypothetical protein C5S49_03525 [Candidatus Methanogaster sp.]|nr:MAG: hypothetical protein C5S49_03525 [ANME-2 cluster archaeon]
MLQREGLLDLWDDRRIGEGEDWYQEIEQAISRAGVAVFLVSADFLTSNFILIEEAPHLLELRDGKGMCIFQVTIKPGTWDGTKWLAIMQVRPEGCQGRAVQGAR